LIYSGHQLFSYIMFVPRSPFKPDLTHKIKPGWKDLPGTNTLAYYEHLYNMDVKSFILLGPGLNLTRQPTMPSSTFTLHTSGTWRRKCGCWGNWRGIMTSGRPTQTHLFGTKWNEFGCQYYQPFLKSSLVTLSGNPYWTGWLSTDDHVVKVACFYFKVK